MILAGAYKRCRAKARRYCRLSAISCDYEYVTGLPARAWGAQTPCWWESAFPPSSQSIAAEMEEHLCASHAYVVADCTSGTITVCAEPRNSMAIHDGGRAGIESGPLNFS